MTLHVTPFELDSERMDIREAKQTQPSVSLWFLFHTFLTIGSIAFGGFMALISVIENRIVKRHGLLEHQEMLDGISLANLLPGPQAVNVVAFVGYRLRGPLGALVSAVAVLIPTFVLMLVLSYLYFKFGEIAPVQKIFRGFEPAVSAIVLSVAWRLGKKTVQGWRELVLVILAFALLLLAPLHLKLYTTLAIVAGFGITGYFIFRQQVQPAGREFQQRPFSKLRFTLVMVSLLSLVVLWFLPLPLQHNSLLFLTLTFASMSLILFGGGYVFIPIIGSVVVLQLGWVTQQQFADGIAMGQVTPGPILISAAFIGYKVHGMLGALLSTIAIFAPPAVLMVTASHALAYIQNSRTMRAVMHGIHCGVIGMIAVAALVLLRSGFPAWPFHWSAVWPAAVILLASLYALIRHNLDVLWIILAAGVLGFLLY